jgi:hypothetical protein
MEQIALSSTVSGFQKEIPYPALILRLHARAGLLILNGTKYEGNR